MTGRSAIIAVTHITTKQDMADWTRAHVDAPGITWSVEPGPGGTMLIVEHAHDRCPWNGTTPAAASATADGASRERPMTGSAPRAELILLY